MTLTAGREAIKPFSFSGGAAPEGYVCTRCRSAGRKLWREYNTCADYTKLFCAACALKNQRKKGPVGEDGKRLDNMGDRTDQIGWLIPAVPTEDGATFWGYSSVPPAGCTWWRGLPTGPS